MARRGRLRLGVQNNHTLRSGQKTEGLTPPLPPLLLPYCLARSAQGVRLRLPSGSAREGQRRWRRWTRTRDNSDGGGSGFSAATGTDTRQQRRRRLRLLYPTQLGQLFLYPCIGQAVPVVPVLHHCPDLVPSTSHRTGHTGRSYRFYIVAQT